MINISDRIGHRERALPKVMSPEEAARLIEPDDIIAVSGFTPAGYPKKVPVALAHRIAKEHFTITLYAGASVGDEVDGALSRVHGVARRLSYHTNGDMRQAINRGDVAFADYHVSQFAPLLRHHFIASPDVAIVEVTGITKEGNLIPATSIGTMETMVQSSKKVIVEVNVTQPRGLEGMHDVYEPKDAPYTEPIPIRHVGDRIGTPYVRCGWDKITAIVASDIPDTPRSFKPIDEDGRKMGGLLVAFLLSEVRHGRLPKNLLPLQSGVGSVSNAVIQGLKESDFSHLSIYTEVLQDGIFDLIDAGKVDMVSTASISVSPEGLQRFYDHIEEYRHKIIIRPQKISNNPEVIRRLGVISMNTAIEVDIYGHVNSTHFHGSQLMNGIGGSGDYARAGYLTIFFTSSTAKGGAISSIVPMCSHVDHTEHDVDVLCTEQGIADLRGLSPVERARIIIRHCAHPMYKDQLTEYLERAIAVTGHQHEPQILSEALSWQQRYLDTGSMRK